MPKKPDESAYEYMSRMMGALEYEYGDLLNTLKTPEAVIDYFDLFEQYDTDMLTGIMEQINNGQSVLPLQLFIKKHKLNWMLTRDSNKFWECEYAE